jgi:septal ring factor EnvC (AmiA/AmiB activator)
VAFQHDEERHMPVRTASLSNRIAANGQALHRAMMRRIASYGPDHEPSEAESALLEERRLLKEQRDKARADGPKRRPSALERLVRTHHPVAKSTPKPKKEAHAKDAAKAKSHQSRADKHAAKAAALEAARRAPKKPAK